MVSNFWEGSRISSQHMSFWCPFLESHLTIHDSNIGVRLRPETQLGTSTLFQNKPDRHFQNRNVIRTDWFPPPPSSWRICSQNFNWKANTYSTLMSVLGWVELKELLDRNCIILATSGLLPQETASDNFLGEIFLCLPLQENCSNHFLARKENHSSDGPSSKLVCCFGSYRHLGFYSGCMLHGLIHPNTYRIWSLTSSLDFQLWRIKWKVRSPMTISFTHVQLTRMVSIVRCNSSKIKPEIWSTYLRFQIAGIGGPKNRNESVSILGVIIFSF